MEGDCKDGGRIQRWDQIRREQFGYVNNFFFGAAIVAVGFFVNFSHGLISLSIRFAIFSMFLSVFFGGICALTRLFDFRYTAKNIREKKDLKKKEESRRLSKMLGMWSWRLLVGQILFLI